MTRSRKLPITPVLMILALSLGMSRPALAKDPLAQDDEVKLDRNRPYRPGTFGLGASINPLFFLDIRNGMSLGPSFKFFLPSPLPIAIQAGIRLDGLGAGLFGAGLDVIYEAPRVHEESFYSVNWYAGLGGAYGQTFGCSLVGCRTIPAGGPRGVVGLGFLLQSAPFETYMEWKPGLVIYTFDSRTNVRPGLIDFAFGGRYFF